LRGRPEVRAGPPWAMRARWVFPVRGEPIPDGAVTVAGDRLAAVGPAGGARPDIHLRHPAVLPGLVHAHPHPALGGLGGPGPPPLAGGGVRGRPPPSPDFTGWLRQVIAHRRGRTPEQVRQDVRAGLAECLRSGTTLLGDITSGGASYPELTRAPARATLFYEV